MKVTKTITTTEEVPFNWDELKKDLLMTDWFNPNNSDDWAWFIEDHLTGYLEYSDEDIKEVEKHKDEITEIMSEKRKREIPDELYWCIGRNLGDLVEGEYKITEQEIHDYITNWFKENNI